MNRFLGMSSWYNNYTIITFHSHFVFMSCVQEGNQQQEDEAVDVST